MDLHSWPEIVPVINRDPERPESNLERHNENLKISGLPIFQNRCTLQGHNVTDRHNADTDQPKRTTLVTSLHTGKAAKSSLPQTSPSVEFSAEEVLSTVISSLEDSKGEEISTIDIKGKSAIGDYMVIASGRSHRHVGAMADHLLRELKTQGFGPAKVEGLQAADWVLVDTGDVIIHIFRPEVREFYGIEKMWTMEEHNERH